MPYTVDFPPKYHAGFNTIEVKISSIDPDTFDLNVIHTKPLTSTTTTTTLRRLTKPQPGQISTEQVRFDMSGIIKTLFDNDSPRMVNDVEVDYRLFVRYQANVLNETRSFVALNSALPIGEVLDFTTLSPDPLTTLPEIVEYIGYPIDVSIFAYTSGSGLFGDAVNRVKLNAIPYELLLANSEGKYIVTSSGKKIVIREGSTTEIGSACVPLSPFYIRWINRLGGIDYYMFDQTQKKEMVTKDFQRSEVFNPSSQTATRTAKTYAMTAEILTTARAEVLSTDTYDALALIPLSPSIEWYNEKLNVWQGINIEKADNEKNTHAESHTIEFVFEMPAPISQFV